VSCLKRIVSPAPGQTEQAKELSTPASLHGGEDTFSPASCCQPFKRAGRINGSTSFFDLTAFGLSGASLALELSDTLCAFVTAIGVRRPLRHAHFFGDTDARYILPILCSCRLPAALWLTMRRP
jgi:hypothetical protein